MSLPPRSFRHAGEIEWVKVAEAAPFPPKRARGNSARAAGIRYERRAGEALKEKFGDNIILGRWYQYKNKEDPYPRHCQPDAIVRDEKRNRISVLEIKHRHTDLAWWQLFELYGPVVREIEGPDWKYCYSEIVRYYDMAVECPQEPRLVRDLEDLIPGVFGVHILNV